MNRLIVGFSVAMFAGSVFAKPANFGYMNNPSPIAQMTLGDVANKVYVVEAFFNACSYCNENAPNVDALATELAGTTGVVVVDLGRDSRRTDYRTWITHHSPNHPVLQDGDLDTGRRLLQELGVTGYPTTFVLDCNLKPVDKTVGLWDGAARSGLKATVQRALRTPCQVEQD